MIKNGTFSLGMLISIIGLVVMAVCTWIGLALNHIAPAIAAVASIVVLLVGGVSVFIGVRAKTAGSDFGKWHTYEIFCIVGMFLALGFAILPTITTFNFALKNGELRDAARQDIDGIDSLIVSFHEQETARMNTTFRGLENFVRHGHGNCSAGMRQYLQDEFRTTPQNFSNQLINNRRGEVRAQIDDIRLGNSMYVNAFANRLENLRAVANATLPVGFGRLGQEMDNTSAQVGEVLTDISSRLNLPVPYAGSSQQYNLTPSEAHEYSFTPTAYSEAYGVISKIQPWSVVFALLCAFAAMFYYIIAYRALRKAVDKGSKVSDRLGLPL